MMDKTIKNKQLLIMLLFSFGIFLRFFVMAFGHNFDFESWIIDGQIASDLHSVYAETTRYNYGPVFLTLLAAMYRISLIRPENYFLYRILIVSLLTLTDILISFFLAKHYSVKAGLLFFLNPVSIIITGYHNQFDNMAVLFALLSTLYFNEEDGLNKKDIGFMIFFSLSLITKHILFLLPVFILLLRKVPLWKRIVYAACPPIIFLLSFLPFALRRRESLLGIINNVFLYRSFNNSPLLLPLFKLINFPEPKRIFIYIFMMIVLAFLLRNHSFKTVLPIYLIAMVSFSSAIANQYLAIPLASLFIFDLKIFDKIYIIFTTIFLVLHSDGLNFLLLDIVSRFPSGTPFNSICTFIVTYGYTISAWLLLLCLVQIMLAGRHTSHRSKA